MCTGFVLTAWSGLTIGLPDWNGVCVGSSLGGLAGLDVHAFSKLDIGLCLLFMESCNNIYNRRKLNCLESSMVSQCVCNDYNILINCVIYSCTKAVQVMV